MLADTSVTPRPPNAQSWRLTGDSYVKKGGKAWISEMYGYAFACAHCDVWHTWDMSLMHYPTVGGGGVLGAGACTPGLEPSTGRGAPGR